VFFVDVDLSDAGQYSSLAMDASGRPHMSYYDAVGNLNYAVGPVEVVGVAEPRAEARGDLTLYPNPSSGGPVRIPLAPGRAAGIAAVEIFDLDGRRLRRLEAAGAAPLIWDGRDESGRRAEPGVHFVAPVSSDGRRSKAQRLVVLH